MAQQPVEWEASVSPAALVVAAAFVVWMMHTREEEVGVLLGLWQFEELVFEPRKKLIRNKKEFHHIHIVAFHQMD